jgi:hypothetical protein
MRAKLGSMGSVLAGIVGSALAVAFIATQVGLVVGGLSYRKDCGNTKGTVTQDWTFTWLAPIPYLFRPNESGCVIHTGTRVALNAVGVAGFSETTTSKIADESLARDASADPDTVYWVRARSALVDYLDRNGSRKTLADALASIDTLRGQLAALEVPAKYADAHAGVIAVLNTMKRHGEDLGAAANSGDRGAYSRAEQHIDPDAAAMQDAIQRLNRVHAGR